MSGVFIGHLGLGQGQNGAPIGPQHVSLPYIRSRLNSLSRGGLFRGRARISVTLPPSQATKPQNSSPFPLKRGRDSRRSCIFCGTPFEPRL
ncbi:hypothetical protein RHMOL_Rhmol01G0183200 [Rhododendron molle]|uniref:Uncharacterized protein n=1 Tax=Rhododendron molle TaxID=49168 RepID=A0ACC0Q4F0_RHOML|nr:hypothetical protein RHMOL_Rhmol01G0183200 [Rhododendron molle]